MITLRNGPRVGGREEEQSGPRILGRMFGAVVARGQRKVFTVMRRHLFARIPTRSGSVSDEDLVARILYYRRQSFRGTG